MEIEFIEKIIILRSNDKKIVKMSPRIHAPDVHLKTPLNV